MLETSERCFYTKRDRQVGNKCLQTEVDVESGNECLFRHTGSKVVAGNACLLRRDHLIFFASDDKSKTTIRIHQVSACKVILCAGHESDERFFLYVIFKAKLVIERSLNRLAFCV